MDQVDAMKWITLFLLSSIKLLWAPGTAIASGLKFWEAWLVTAAGGMLGVVVFYNFGHLVFAHIDRLRHRRYRQMGKAAPVRKSFTRRNRWIVLVKGKFGLIGLAIITPTLLSIPVGSMIAARFFYNKRRTLPYLLLSTLVWTFALSFFFAYLRTILFIA